MNEALRRARLRLTAWYVGVFAAILLLFGGGIYVAVTRQISRGLDQQLVTAAEEVERAMAIRERERGLVGAVDALQELRLPGRDWYVVSEGGQTVGPAAPPAFLAPFARVALDQPEGVWGRPETEEVSWRVYARRFDIGGDRYAVLTVASAVELEDRYAGLLVTFVLATIAALVLVAVGGAALARRSLVPVDAAMERMRSFVADASHELRTPAAVLRTRAEVTLQRPRTVEEYTAIVSRMGDEARRLGHLVDGLLILAASDEQRLALRREPVFLDDLLVDASELVWTLAASKGVSLELAEFEEAPVDADPGLIRQLFIILLENAVKFTPASGHVRASVQTDDTTCRVTVRDTGPGIEPEMLPHVFERFYRADPDGHAEQGSGIGLAIARTIVDAHEADIAVTSDLGEGTTVRVTFPRRVISVLAAFLLCLAGSAGLPVRAAAQDGISLQEALARAETAPEIEAAVADSAFFAAAADGARAFPNPLLALGYSRSTPRYHVEAELPLDYPWLRGPRIESATARAASVGLGTDVARATQRYRVELAYAEAAGARALLELSQQAVQADADLVRVAEARQASGDAAALDVAVARIALGASRSALVTDSLSAEDAAFGLQSLLGMTQEVLLAFPSDSLADLWAPMNASTPPPLRLAGADSLLSAERAALSLARRSRFPAPALRFGFETGDPGGTEKGFLPTVGVSIPVPVFDRGGASVTQAEAAVRRAEAGRSAVLREIEAVRAKTERRWRAARDRLVADVSAVESALQVASLAQDAYREGAYPLASVLEARRGAREALARRIQDLVEARSAAAARRFAATAGGGVS